METIHKFTAEVNALMPAIQLERCHERKVTQVRPLTHRQVMAHQRNAIDLMRLERHILSYVGTGSASRFSASSMLPAPAKLAVTK